MSESHAPRAVVDTNVFGSGALNPYGRPAQVVLAWFDNRFRLLLSERQLNELSQVFERPNVARRVRGIPGGQAELIARLVSAVQDISVGGGLFGIRDPKDEPILAAAIGAADYLVTGDDDLLVLRDDPRLGALKIVTAAQFLAALEDPQSGAIARS